MEKLEIICKSRGGDEFTTDHLVISEIGDGLLRVSVTEEEESWSGASTSCINKGDAIKIISFLKRHFKI